MNGREFGMLNFHPEFVDSLLTVSMQGCVQAVLPVGVL